MEVSPGLITAGTAILSGLIGAVVTGLFGRKKANADADVRSSEGFQLLVSELRKERMELIETIEKQSAKIEKQSMEITSLTMQLHDLQSTVKEMYRAWKRGEAAPDVLHTELNRG